MIGGALGTYASWRVTQLLLAVMGLGIAAIVLVYLPETSHPGVRGLDKLLAQERAKNMESGTIRPEDGNENQNQKVEAWRWVWLNPFSTLTLLKSPVILLLVKIRNMLITIVF